MNIRERFTSSINRLLLAGMITTVACDATDKYTPVEWAHGWKTYRVTATRYSNDIMGYNIGLEFPMDPNNCDRAEIATFLKEKKGYPYEMGGHPGAPIYVIFNDVYDRPTADVKLKVILPGFTRLMERLR